MDWAQLERGADSCEGGGALSSGAWLPFAVGSSTPWERSWASSEQGCREMPWHPGASLQLG